MVNTPTRGSNVLDIFITDRPSLVESCDTVDGISDHEAVFIESLVTAHLTLPSRRTIYLWSQADLQNVKNRTGSLCEEFVSSYSSSIPVEILWNNFVRICNTCLDLVPTKLSSSSFKQPWITTHIKRLSRRKQRAYNYARKTNEAQQWSNYYNLKRECQRECRTAYNNMCLTNHKGFNCTIQETSSTSCITQIMLLWLHAYKHTPLLLVTHLLKY